MYGARRDSAAPAPSSPHRRTYEEEDAAALDFSPFASPALQPQQPHAHADAGDGAAADRGSTGPSRWEQIQESPLSLKHSSRASGGSAYAHVADLAHIPYGFGGSAGGGGEDSPAGFAAHAPHTPHSLGGGGGGGGSASSASSTSGLLLMHQHPARHTPLASKLRLDREGFAHTPAIRAAHPLMPGSGQLAMPPTFPSAAAYSAASPAAYPGAIAAHNSKEAGPRALMLHNTQAHRGGGGGGGGGGYPGAEQAQEPFPYYSTQHPPLAYVSTIHPERGRSNSLAATGSTLATAASAAAAAGQVGMHAYPAAKAAYPYAPSSSYAPASSFMHLQHQHQQPQHQLPHARPMNPQPYAGGGAAARRNSMFEIGGGGGGGGGGGAEDYRYNNNYGGLPIVGGRTGHLALPSSALVFGDPPPASSSATSSIVGSLATGQSAKYTHAFPLGNFAVDPTSTPALTLNASALLSPVSALPAPSVITSAVGHANGTASAITSPTSRGGASSTTADSGGCGSSSSTSSSSLSSRRLSSVACGGLDSSSSFALQQSIVSPASSPSSSSGVAAALSHSNGGGGGGGGLLASSLQARRGSTASAGRHSGGGLVSGNGLANTGEEPSAGEFQHAVLSTILSAGESEPPSVSSRVRTLRVHDRGSLDSQLASSQAATPNFSSSKQHRRTESGATGADPFSPNQSPLRLLFERSPSSSGTKTRGGNGGARRRVAGSERRRRHSTDGSGGRDDGDDSSDCSARDAAAAADSALTSPVLGVYDAQQAHRHHLAALDLASEFAAETQLTHAHAQQPSSPLPDLRLDENLAGHRLDTSKM